MFSISCGLCCSQNVGIVTLGKQSTKKFDKLYKFVIAINYRYCNIVMISTDMFNTSLDTRGSAIPFEYRVVFIFILLTQACIEYTSPTYTCVEYTSPTWTCIEYNSPTQACIQNTSPTYACIKYTSQHVQYTSASGGVELFYGRQLDVHPIIDCDGFATTCAIRAYHN